ncbi:uncharacterized protein MYCFIDRAFT_192510 [Pseudocercospora fijiensis CIRAD86]|uniref:Uncharacterized protein n=1 Tax=Pseudocercospora fijiensis (strain CIRAD86) TaxID=383855 RepID=N1Q6X3_PSEFD|nr:uncharacterized protein MYCFIDRAFT_192510 [Pseudocercospora fijiensis CIRAD86]EME88309.1 hypothetical protein MYCFIDRAFT_192510 [Pseudocercospora fijiensis CIRAD86]
MPGSEAGSIGDEPRPISTLNSSSTAAVTLVDNDEFMTPVLSPLALIDRKLHAASHIVQTPDRKQWIDLDVLSPKLLRELRKQYDTQLSDQPRSMAKGAARIKAWTRQTKIGFDIRLRRKLSTGRDQVTDIVVQDQLPWNEPKGIALPELPSEGMFELPDNSRTSELPSTPLDSNMEDAADEQDVETLPEYSGPTDPSPQLRLQIPSTVLDGDSGIDSRSPSVSSIVATPTDGLAVEDWIGQLDDARDNDVEKPELNDGRPRTDPIDIKEPSDQHDQVAADIVNALLAEIRGSLAKDAAGGDLNLQSGQNVAKTYTYETEADAVPASPIGASGQTPSPCYLQKGRSTVRMRNKLKSKPLHGLDPPRSHHEPRRPALQRRATVPKRATIADGPEAAWKVALQGQKKLIGGKHPLTWKAKYALAESRKNQHKECSSDLLDSLRESEHLSVKILGSVHPDVAAFSANLETLATLIVSEEDDTVGSVQEISGSEASTNSFQPDEDAPNTADIIQNNGLSRDIVQEHPLSSHQAPTSGDVQEPEGALPALQTTFPDRPEANDTDRLREQLARDALWSSWRPPHKPRNNAQASLGIILEAMANTVKEGISWLQDNYGPEPEPKDNHVRVRWTCSCGQPLYDDFEERKPGAARELEAYLNRPRTHTPGTPTSPSSSSGTRSFSSSFGGAQSSQTSWSSFGQPVHNSCSGEEKSQQTFSTSSLPFYTPYTPLTDPPWLLTCANEAQHSPKMAHLDMSPHKIKSDRDLAIELRSHYSFINRRWQRFLKLRGLSTINFVQFECHQNRFADIRKTPDMPPTGKIDYSFEPGDLIPPVGSQYLLHLFKHPEEYDGEMIAYLRVPKKKGRLALGVGWGVHLVEGFMPDRVWMCVNLFFAFVDGSKHALPNQYEI